MFNLNSRYNIVKSHFIPTVFSHEFRERIICISTGIKTNGSLMFKNHLSDIAKSSSSSQNYLFANKKKQYPLMVHPLTASSQVVS